jgi:tRNA threonylcarbamoyl adenosine modification protein YjeE
VPSPTFTLVQTYPFARYTVHHFDLYRIAEEGELRELGFEEALAGVSLIEWPERLGAFLPADRLDVALSSGNGPETRIAEITPHGSWRGRLRDAGIDG